MSVSYDARTALIIVDVQNDFADPKGSLYVRGAEAVIPLIDAEILRALASGALIIRTRDWHPSATPHFQKDGGIWPVHCVRDTWGAAFHPGLAVAGEVISKGTGGEDGYSAFAMRDPQSGATQDTPLAARLAERGIQRLVVAGLATDYCVRATVLDGLARGYAVTVLTDAVRAVDLEPGDGERALAEMSQRGAVLA